MKSLKSLTGLFICILYGSLCYSQNNREYVEYEVLFDDPNYEKLSIKAYPFTYWQFGGGNWEFYYGAEIDWAPVSRIRLEALFLNTFKYSDLGYWNTFRDHDKVSINSRDDDFRNGYLINLGGSFVISQKTIKVQEALPLNKTDLPFDRYLLEYIEVPVTRKKMISLRTGVLFYNQMYNSHVYDEDRIFYSQDSTAFHQDRVIFPDGSSRDELNGDGWSTNFMATAFYAGVSKTTISSSGYMVGSTRKMHFYKQLSAYADVIYAPNVTINSISFEGVEYDIFKVTNLGFRFGAIYYGGFKRAGKKTDTGLNIEMGWYPGIKGGNFFLNLALFAPVIQFR